MKSKRAEVLFESMGFEYGEGQSIVFEHAVDAIKLAEPDAREQAVRAFCDRCGKLCQYPNDCDRLNNFIHNYENV